MERTYKFKEGQRVKMNDPIDGLVYGVVTDTTSVSVFIKWEDLNEPTEHFTEEFSEIKLRSS